MIALRNKYRRRTLSDAALLRAFERREFGPDEMTHRRCIRLAYIHIKQHRLNGAMSRMRAGLQAIADAEGVEQSEDIGYSETWTFAWLAIIYATMWEFGAEKNSQAFFKKHTHLTNIRLLRLYYSSNIWLERDCDSKFEMPDLAPLPQPRELQGAW